MASDDRAENLFDQIDTNRDGRIDGNEIRNWTTGNEEQYTSTCESGTNRFNRYDTGLSRADQFMSYEAIAGLPGYNTESAIHTSSAEETNRYLDRSASNIFRDSNPRIIRRPAPGSPLTHEQRVSIRYLRPPTPPPPGPLIIKEIRPEQPSPPPPLIIQEHPPKPATPPPLILRERPPTPPKPIPSETTTRLLSPIPVPPRSVVIERFPPPPPKPRDIIIERWLPYGPQRERRTIVEPAPPPVRYPEPTHTVVLHENLDSKVIRKFENLGISREDPQNYTSRFGSGLLDSLTLVNEARRAGVAEDISPPAGSSSITTDARDYTSDYYRSSDLNKYKYSTALKTGSDNVKRNNYSLCNSRYLSSSYNRINDTSSNCNAANFSAKFQVDGGGLCASIRVGDGETKEFEYKRYV